MLHLHLAVVACCLQILRVTCLTSSELSMMESGSSVEQNTGLIGSISVAQSGDTLTLTSNGIPDHDTGTFPGIGNPNSISEQSYSYEITNNPAVADEPTCLPMGVTAFGRNGVPLFNPYALGGNDAVETEAFDSCNGHPDQTGSYHYHQTPNCFNDTNGGRDEFIGVALDGFPIYGSMDANGNTITNDDLDDCHGHIYNGAYRYRLTSDFPYVMGCFKGTPSSSIDPGRLTSTRGCSFAYSAAERVTAVGTLVFLGLATLLSA